MDNEHGSDHSTAGLSAERIGRNDAIFRHANEQINDVAEAGEIDGRSLFICECADMHCQEIVRMTLGEYAEIRQDARLFLNVPGHEASAQAGRKSSKRTTNTSSSRRSARQGTSPNSSQGTWILRPRPLISTTKRRHDDPV